MLMLLGYLMVTTFMILIMTRRLSALVALTLIPFVFGMLTGHGTDLGPMAVNGITHLAPIATLLLFAALYFAVMIDVGLFDPLVSRIRRIAGDDPVRVAIGTAIVALIVSLDGDGATTALVTISAFLPVYRRINMNPLVLATILGSANTVMNLFPWGGPLARAAASLHVDPADIFVPLIPTIVAGIGATLAIAWYLGHSERSRLASGDVAAAEEAVSEITFKRDESLIRPQLLYVNLSLTLAVLASAIARLLPLPIAFMAGLSLALVINYPCLIHQRGRLKAHAESALPIVLLVLAAGAFTGIMSGTGMTDAMAKGATRIVPPALGPCLGVVTALLSAPLTFTISSDAFYFGVVPIIAQTASQYDVAPVVIARASLLALPIHGLSPLIVAIYLVAGLLGVEVGALQRFALKWAALLTLVLIGTAVVTGAIL